jgi:EmrB/QacA subfamily drug resistance transporter
MCVASFMIQLDVTIVNVALPRIQQGLALTVGQLEWVVSGYALSLAAFIPLAGALGDRFGHRFVFVIGLVTFGIGSAGCATANGGLALIIARFVQGVGGAAMLTLTLAIINQTYPPSMRARAIGTWAAIGGTGFGAGPVTGGLLLGSFGWASIFWVNLPFILVAVVMAAVVVPYTHSSATKRTIDGPGIMLASVGVACITFALIESTTRPWQAILTLIPALVGLLALAFFAAWQRRAPFPLVPASLRRAPSFIGASFIYFASYTAFAGTLYYVTLLFQNLKGWSPLDTGISWLLMNIPFLVTAQLAGRLDRHFAPRLVITSACALAAIGIGTLATLTTTTAFLVAAAGYVVAGVGFGALVPGITHVAMRDVPPDSVGAGSAVLNCSRQLGTATGLAMIGALGAAATTSSWASETSGQSIHAAALAMEVVSGRLELVVQALGSGFREAAIAAFVRGYHLALVACVACLLIARLVAANVFKAESKRPHSQ